MKVSQNHNKTLTTLKLYKYVYSTLCRISRAMFRGTIYTENFSTLLIIQHIPPFQIDW